MAQRNTSSFKSTKNARYADSTSGEISAGDSRDMFEDTADSFLNISDHFIDEDSFASDSATKVPSQQSVKAYVDTQVGGSGLQTATVTLSSAEILALNDTPKQIVAAPGSGKVHIIHQVFAIYTFVTAQYATNTNLYIGWSGVTTPFSGLLTYLAGTVSRHSINIGANIGVTDNLSNKALEAWVPSGNPTAGDSTVKIIVTYSTIDI